MKYALSGSALNILARSELVSASEQGVFNESEHCDPKRGLPIASQHPEIARDLASLTVLGGMFLVGVKDAGYGAAGEVLRFDDPSSVATRLGRSTAPPLCA